MTATWRPSGDHSTPTASSVVKGTRRSGSQSGSEYSATVSFPSVRSTIAARFELVLHAKTADELLERD